MQRGGGVGNGAEGSEDNFPETRKLLSMLGIAKKLEKGLGA